MAALLLQNGGRPLAVLLFVFMEKTMIRVSIRKCMCVCNGMRNAYDERSCSAWRFVCMYVHLDIGLLNNKVFKDQW
jgi:hypothetical protein